MLGKLHGGEGVTISSQPPLAFSIPKEMLAYISFYHAIFLLKGKPLALGQDNLGLCPGSWAIYLTSLTLRFIIYQMGLIYPKELLRLVSYEIFGVLET